MALFDMPLPMLEAYRGSSPLPEDFDAYWERSLAELGRTPPHPRFERNTTLSTRSAECFDLWFTGIGEARLYAKFLKPRAPGPHPAILQFHGLSGSSGDWADKLAFVAERFCVFALDCRGQGGRSQDPGGVIGNTLRGHIIRGLEEPDPSRLLYRSHFLDTAQLARIALNHPEVDPGRVCAMGGSQGGALSLACAALEPRISRVVSIFPFLCDFRRVWELDLAKDAYEDLTHYLRRFDPRHERVQEMFRKLAYIDVQNLAPRIQAKVLMLTGLMDTVCPPSTQFAAFNKLRSPKRMVTYPDFGHEFLPDQHDLTLNHVS